MLHERERFLNPCPDRRRTDPNHHLVIGWLGVAVMVLIVLLAIAGMARAEQGIASYYGRESGPRTASGERFDPNALTAAHRTLPFGTIVRVTHSRDGRSVIVRINDRGPFIKGRIIDLSAAAAQAIGMIEAGIAPVTLEIIR
jgi:rare lipoprotein A